MGAVLTETSSMLQNANTFFSSVNNSNGNGFGNNFGNYNAYENVRVGGADEQYRNNMVLWSGDAKPRV
jgi:hypothetical protein